jgi:hypothetical protein
MGKIEDLKAQKARIEKQISQLRIRESNDERKADMHIKAALGGAVMIALNDTKVPHTFKKYLLDIADTGVQKSGLGREKFEALKTRHTPAVTAASA